mgnify:CR=1 FL=1
MFPEDQLLWMRTEDYKAAPAEHIQALIRFLGMRTLTQEEVVTMMRLRRFNAQNERYPRMWPQVGGESAYCACVILKGAMVTHCIRIRQRAKQ